jgi:thioredoxin reductase (NADPH)
MGKVLVLGAGPAGVSAALYARRGGAEVTVLHKGLGTGALGRAEKIENYYGLAEPVTGAELERRGIAGAVALGIDFVEDELVELGYRADFKGYKARSAKAEYEADALIIAAGASRKTLSLPGIRELEGHGVSYCATCDAFFYRGKTVAVLGAGDYALHEAEALLPHAAKVYLLANGGEVDREKLPQGLEVRPEQLASLQGEGRVEKAVFEDGSELPLDGLFIALGTAGSTELARKLGVMLENGNIKTDEHMATNVPGIFAAGDCTGGLLQIAKAVYQGAEAGLAAVRYLRNRT